MQRLANPFPLFLDEHGGLLDAGYVYIGTVNADPEGSPISVYWDAAGTIPAAQPLRTRGGVIVNSGSPAQVWIAAADYSQRVRDADGNQVSYAASSSDTGGVSYQPLDANLTAIAALSTQSFGRSLLTAATAAAAKALLGIGSYLASAGGTVTGNILRSGAGPYTYHADGSMTSGKITVTAPGASDPTTTNGEIWIEAA
jgi:hypothetical protein